MRRILLLFLFAVPVFAQGPTISLLSPNSVGAGSGQFLMSVTGTNLAGGTVQWTVGTVTTPLSTTTISATQLNAFVPFFLVASPGTANVNVMDAASAQSNTLPFTITAPAITSLTPPSRTAGASLFTLTVNGSGFVVGPVGASGPASSDSTIVFGGTTLSTVVVSSTQLTATVDAFLISTPGVVNVTVENPGAILSAPFPFTVLPAPTVTGTVPNTRTAGSAAFTLQVIGANYVNGATVIWDQSPLTTTFVSATQVTAAVPAALVLTPGTHAISVASPDGVISSGVDFTVNAAPTISTLAPVSRTAGATAFPLTVAGTNFASGMTVQWNGGNLVTTFVNASQLTANVPANLITSAGSASVTVLTVDGVSSNAATFTINPGPSITNLTPSSVTAGHAAFTLTVTGLNFPAGAVVQWNGADQETTVGTIGLAITVPANLVASAGTANVTVLTPDGAVSPPAAFTINPTPTITSLNPAARIVGSPGFTLTVNGSGFRSGATVQWNGSPLATTFVNAAQLTAAASAALVAQSGSAAVTVISPDGVASNAVNFAINLIPLITSLVPASHTAGSAAFTLTVNGANFTANLTVSWNGSPLATTFVGATQLTAAVPANLVSTAGTASVTVGDGIVSSAPSTFTISAAPTITNLSPASRTATAPGFTLTVNGTNFASGMAVCWNGSPLATTFVSATQVTAAVPAALIASAGSFTITVVTVDAVNSNPATFTVAGVPAITSLSPTDRVTGAGEFTLTVAGTAFANGATVIWDGTPLRTTFVSPTRLSATVPAILTAAAGTAQVAVSSADGVVSPAIDFAIRNPALQITTTTLPAGLVGAAYSQTVSVTGGSGDYAFALISGSLPPGFAPFGRAGQISGTTTTAGTYTFTVQVTDLTDSTQPVKTQQYALVINALPLLITTASPLPDTQAGPIALTLAATGGVLPYTWAVTGGSLPPGVSLSTAGDLSGTATTAGSYLFNATVTDSARVFASQAFRIKILPAPVTITSSSLPAATVQAAYSATLAAAGGTPPYTWAVSGLPPGLTADAATGAIGGKPTVDGNYTLTVKATDSAGASGSGSVALSVVAAPLTIDTKGLPDSVAGVAYSATLSASGGVPPYSWSFSGEAPAGFSIAKDGILSGSSPAAAVLSFTVQVVDTKGASATAAMQLKVAAAPLLITTASLPNGTAGASYTQTLAATGGTPPFTWSATLPAALTIDAKTGVISGSPQVAGSATLAVTVTDAAGTKVSKSYPVQFAMPSAPGMDLAGVPATAVPLGQPSIQFGLSSPYALPITGTVTLTFKADSGPDDPTVVFSNGKRTATFSIAAGSTASVFSPPGLAFQAGTTAGIVTLTWNLQSGGQDITPSPAPTKQIRIAAAVPSISSVVATRTSSGFTVQIIGYSTTREVTQARFILSGLNLGATDFTVNTASLFSAWFQSASSAQFGSQFLYTQPFTVQGDPNGIISVSVSLTNSQGTALAVTATLR